MRNRSRSWSAERRAAAEQTTASLPVAPPTGGRARLGRLQRQRRRLETREGTGNSERQTADGRQEAARGGQRAENNNNNKRRQEPAGNSEQLAGSRQQAASLAAPAAPSFPPASQPDEIESSLHSRAFIVSCATLAPPLPSVACEFGSRRFSSRRPRRRRRLVPLARLCCTIVAPV